MKKTLALITLIIMMILSCTVVKAVTSDELPDVLYNMGKKYGVTRDDKTRIERYVNDHEITDAQCNAIVAKLREAVKIMEDENEIDFRKISQEKQNRIKQIMIEAGEIVDVKVVFKNYSIYLYDKDGKLIDVRPVNIKNPNNPSDPSKPNDPSNPNVPNTPNKYAPTGSQFNIALPIIILIAIAPLVAGVITKKNAKE